MSYTNKSKTTRARKNYTATPVWEVRVGNGKNAESIQVIGCYKQVLNRMLRAEFMRIADQTVAQVGRAAQAYAKANENVTLKRVGMV